MLDVVEEGWEYVSATSHCEDESPRVHSAHWRVAAHDWSRESISLRGKPNRHVEVAREAEVCIHELDTYVYIKLVEDAEDKILKSENESRAPHGNATTIVQDSFSYWRSRVMQLEA